MVGGNLQEDNTEIWSRMVEAAGGPGVSRSFSSAEITVDWKIILQLSFSPFSRPGFV